MKSTRFYFTADSGALFVCSAQPHCHSAALVVIDWGFTHVQITNPSGAHTEGSPRIETEKHLSNQFHDLAKSDKKEKTSTFLAEAPNWED